MGNVAALYIAGKGVAADDNQGLYWLRKAAAAGYEPAKATMEKLARLGVK